MNIHRHDLKRFILLLSSLSLIVSTSPIKSNVALGNEPGCQMRCCSAEVVTPCVHTSCCKPAESQQLPPPVDQQQPPGKSNLKDCVAVAVFIGGDVEEKTRHPHDRGLTVASAAQSLIAQHIRLQI